MGSSLDVERIKADFPILDRQIDGKRLVYLDSAASSQKPTAVLHAMDEHYRTYYANIHRGVYTIAEESTAAYEAARGKIARFIGAPSPSQVIFTKNVTEAINLFAYSWGRTTLRECDAVLVTEMEHHANVVPWHILAAERGIEVRWVPLTSDYQLDLTDLDRLLDGAKALGVTAMSNVLGTFTPVRTLTDAARAAGAVSIIDGCQSVPHSATDVQELGCDFLAFSAHKLCGPTGIGVLYGREELLAEMPPFLGGGEMIRDVTLEGFTTNDLPWKFEAGTPPIAEAIGLGAAVDYLNSLGMDRIRAHERALTDYAITSLTERFGHDLRIHGPQNADERGGVLSFAYKDLHPHDISQVLDQHAVCVRAGHHCAKPLMKLLGVGATARASVYVYNDTSDIDALADALQATGDFFAL
jgi:cysteine desulfurase/selenocysteine lyase